uniref:Uncharacterized protein n=1 Tax=Timema monikensis TaxID=170555 RepID=A0A7R9HTH9_9NEOP|nr:unnamed protein product [Timema monikensis]
MPTSDAVVSDKSVATNADCGATPELEEYPITRKTRPQLLPPEYPITRKTRPQLLPLEYPITRKTRPQLLPLEYPITRKTRPQLLPLEYPITRKTYESNIKSTCLPIRSAQGDTEIVLLQPESNLDLPLIDNLVYCESSALDHETTKKRTTNPTRAIMYSGYFGSPQGYHYNPPYPGNTYDPQGAMTSFAEGNTVSARSYYGNEYQPSNTYPHCGNCGYQQPSNGQSYPNLAPENTGEVLPPGDVISTQQPEEQSKEKPKPTVTDIPDVQVSKRNEQPEIENEAHIPTEQSIKPLNGNNKTIDIPDSNKSKTPRLIPNSPKEDDDDDQDYEEETNNGPLSFPGKNLGPGKNYNSYFPVYFGLPGYGSRSQGEGGPLNPGVATAIANSFSNGRGAVATSHATAYGGPNFDSGYKKG